MVQGGEGEARGPSATLPAASPASSGRSCRQAEACGTFLGSEGLPGRPYSRGEGEELGLALGEGKKGLRPPPSPLPHCTGRETEAGDSAQVTW